jgi:hypothetical protein
MQFALIAVRPVSEIPLLARAAFGVVFLLCLGVPAVSGIWSSLNQARDRGLAGPG